MDDYYETDDRDNSSAQDAYAMSEEEKRRRRENPTMGEAFSDGIDKWKSKFTDSNGDFSLGKTLANGLMSNANAQTPMEKQLQSGATSGSAMPAAPMFHYNNTASQGGSAIAPQSTSVQGEILPPQQPPQPVAPPTAQSLQPPVAQSQAQMPPAPVNPAQQFTQQQMAGVGQNAIPGQQTMMPGSNQWQSIPVPAAPPVSATPSPSNVPQTQEFAKPPEAIAPTSMTIPGGAPMAAGGVDVTTGQAEPTQEQIAQDVETNIIKGDYIGILGDAHASQQQLAKIVADPDTDPIAKRVALDRMMTLAKAPKEMAKANKTIDDATTGQSPSAAREVNNALSPPKNGKNEGSWLRALLLAKLGLGEAATHEFALLGVGSTEHNINLDGTNGVITMDAKGKIIKGYMPDGKDGGSRDMTSEELAKANEIAQRDKKGVAGATRIRDANNVEWSVVPTTTGSIFYDTSGKRGTPTGKTVPITVGGDIGLQGDLQMQKLRNQLKFVEPTKRMAYAANFDQENGTNFSGSLKQSMPEFFGGTPATQGGATGGTVVDRILNREGGYVANDAGKGPTNFGINSTANPDVDVKNLTREGAAQIIQERYINKIQGYDKLSPASQELVADAAVNQGVGYANNLVKNLGDNPDAIRTQRERDYRALAESNPQKFGQYMNSWMDRIKPTGEPTQTTKEGTVPNMALPNAGIEFDPKIDKSAAGFAARQKAAAETQKKYGIERAEEVAKIQANQPALEKQVDQMLRDTESLVNHPGFETSVGAKGASYLFGLKDEPLPHQLGGGDAKDWQSKQKQIQSKSFLQAFDVLRGGGQITNIEGDKATAAINRMSDATSEKEFLAAKRDFDNFIKESVNTRRAALGQKPKYDISYEKQDNAKLYSAADAIIGK